MAPQTSSDRILRANRLARLRAFVGAAIAATLLACGGENAPPAKAGDAVTKSRLSLPGASSAAVSEKLTYRMTGTGGALRNEHAVVLIPTGTAPPDGWPVLAWGHGASGVADQCAPSASANLRGELAFLNALLAQGFAIVASDFEGLGSAGAHPYLNLESEARSMLQSVNAALSAYPVLANKVVVAGYSQGGHAALGAAQFSALTPNINLLGSVAMAPLSNVAAQAELVLASIINNSTVTLGTRVEATRAWVGFTSLILAGVKAADASFAFDAALGPDAIALDLQALTLTNACLDDLFDELTVPVQNVISPGGDIANLIPPATWQLPALVAYLTMNEPGTVKLSEPVLLLQGDEDSSVLASSTQALSETLSRNGTETTYRTFSATHQSLLESTAALDTLVEFLRARFSAANP